MIKLPKGVDLNNLLLFLRETGIKSASILRDFENGSISLYDFDDNSQLHQNNTDPVTAADLAVNKLFLDKFEANYPNVKWEIVSEENAKENFKKNQSLNNKNSWVWMIDPLDGTKDFIQKTGEYAIHVALLYDNKPVLGMVLLPRLKEIWFGIDGFGTWKESEESSSQKKDLKIFSKREVVNVITSKNHNNQKLGIILEEMKFKNIIKMGSIGFKVCSLLRNEGDIYISISGKTSPKDWDLAAPHALIKYANFSFTYASGNEINYYNKNFEQRGCIIVSTLSKREHLKICNKVSSIIKKSNF